MTTKHPLIANHEILVSAGVWDVLSAKLTEQAGFSTVVLSERAMLYDNAARFLRLGEEEIARHRGR